MKLKLFLIALLFLLVALASRAQSPAVVYRGFGLGGAMHGGSDSEWQLQIIQGISYKTFFAGAGIGIDPYYQRSIPVFLDLRKNILQKKQTPFLYLDLGASLPADRNTGETIWLGSVTSKYRSGYYYDLGAGYSIPVKGRFSFVMSLGYSQKSMKVDKTYTYDSDFIGPFGSEVYYENYNYTFRRLSFKIGVGF
jgi:hypothetical protein